MGRNYFRIEVKIKPTKEIRMPYDKRVMDNTCDFAIIIRALVQAYGGIVLFKPRSVLIFSLCIVHTAR